MSTITEDLAFALVSMHEWCMGRKPLDAGDCKLMIAFWHLRGDWPGDEEHPPVCAGDAIRNLKLQLERFVMKEKAVKP